VSGILGFLSQAVSLSYIAINAPPTPTFALAAHEGAKS